jgi:hypothetical protein
MNRVDEFLCGMPEMPWIRRRRGDQARQTDPMPRYSASPRPVLGDSGMVVGGGPTSGQRNSKVTLIGQIDGNGTLPDADSVGVLP